MLANPKFYGVVAEIDGRVVGSNFLDERNPIAGVGPITVDPAVQNRAVGRRLMDAVHDRAAANNFAGVRLIQAGFHTRSLALYAKLGYDVREHLACMQGNALNIAIEGHIVRPAAEADVDACNRVCRQMHGHERDGELRDAIARGNATVVEHDGRVTGYATIVGFFGHAVGETNADVKGSSALQKNSPDQVFFCRRATATFPLVPDERFTSYAANDFDESRPVQRTSRRIPAIDTVLIAISD